VDVPGERALGTYGMDQDFYPWSPIVTRPILMWPDNARVALAVIVHFLGDAACVRSKFSGQVLGKTERVRGKTPIGMLRVNSPVRPFRRMLRASMGGKGGFQWLLRSHRSLARLRSIEIAAARTVRNSRCAERRERPVSSPSGGSSKPGQLG
jgi:hypothetical protein